MRKMLIVAFVIVSLMGAAAPNFSKIFISYGISESRALLFDKILKEEHQMCPEIDPAIIIGIIYTESSFGNIFGDHGNAVGYMQLHNDAIMYVATFYPDVRKFIRSIKHDIRKLIKFPGWQIRIGYRYLCLLYRNVADENLFEAIRRYNGSHEYLIRVLMRTTEILTQIKNSE